MINQVQSTKSNNPILNILQFTFIRLHSNLFYLLFSIIYFFFIFYSFRGVYLKSFDATFWKDKYEQSQWKLPLSIRTIGDDGLYLYEGWRLVHGEDPTVLNAEVPPLGKYLIGTSLLLFHNGNLYGFITTACVIVLFHFITRKLFNPVLSICTTILFAFDPLLLNQFPLTMLDSLQLCFLLLTMLLLLSVDKPVVNHFIHTILLSIAVAGFAQTKAPLFVPMLGGIVLWTMWSHWKSIRSLVLFGFLTTVLYILPYAQYFHLGHSLIDFLKVQKWIIHFYMSGGIQGKIGALFSTLLYNRYPDLFSGKYSPIGEWSFLWPIITAVGLYGIYRFIKTWSQNIQQSQSVLIIWTLSIVIMLSIIPLWPRYLLLVLPFLYILFSLQLSKSINQKRTVGIISLLFIVQCFSALPVFFPSPAGMFRQFTYSWENGLFRDMYEELSTESQKPMTRDAFFLFGKTIWHEGEIEQAFVKYNSQLLDSFQDRFSHQITVPVTVSFVTRNLGAFKEQQYLSLIKENNRWKMNFDWSMYIRGLTQKTRLDTNVIRGKRGSIKNWVETPISEDFDSILISIKPDEVDTYKEDEMTKFLEGLFGTKIQAIAIHHRYVFNSMPSMTIPIGVLPSPLLSSDKETLLTFPGVKLSQSTGRLEQDLVGFEIGKTRQKYFYECCSYLYSPTNYHGVSGIEMEKEAILRGQNGGTLTIINPSSGTLIRTIIDQNPIVGLDVILEKPDGI